MTTLNRDGDPSDHVRLVLRVEPALHGYLDQARDLLAKAGVTFDYGFSVETGDVDWELDWSLSGARVVIKEEIS